MEDDFECAWHGHEIPLLEWSKRVCWFAAALNVLGVPRENGELKIGTVLVN